MCSSALRYEGPWGSQGLRSGVPAITEADLRPTRKSHGHEVPLARDHNGDDLGHADRVQANKERRVKLRTAARIRTQDTLFRRTLYQDLAIASQSIQEQRILTGQ